MGWGPSSCLPIFTSIPFYFQPSIDISTIGFTSICTLSLFIELSDLSLWDQHFCIISNCTIDWLIDLGLASGDLVEGNFDHGVLINLYFPFSTKFKSKMFIYSKYLSYDRYIDHSYQILDSVLLSNLYCTQKTAQTRFAFKILSCKTWKLKRK